MVDFSSFNFGSDEVPKEDNSPVLRKIWALGQAFYYIDDYYNANINKKDHQDIITKLLIIKNISKNLQLGDDKLNAILDDLLPKDTTKQRADEPGQNVNDTSQNNSVLVSENRKSFESRPYRHRTRIRVYFLSSKKLSKIISSIKW